MSGDTTFGVTKPGDTTGRQVKVPLAGGSITLRVPDNFSDSTLFREIASQDVIRKKLLEALEKLERSTGSNRELLLCPRMQLHATSQGFLSVSHDLRRFAEDLATFHSSIPELEEARGTARTLFRGQLEQAINTVEVAQKELFGSGDDLAERHLPEDQLIAFRKKLAKSAGRVRTDLQRIFAHLLARDPRNLFRAKGPRSEQEILFRQFKREVAVTERLYTAVRRLDTYMRGAIVPSDLLQLVADKIEREGSIACLFDPDYKMFFDALVEESLETLIPELHDVLNLDGIWYDDFENIETKSSMLSDACLVFKALFTERWGLRQEIEVSSLTFHELQDPRIESWMRSMLQTFNTYRHREIAASVRLLDQVLVDLEGALLQWEQGITRRAFALPEWQQAVPLKRRGGS